MDVLALIGRVVLSGFFIFFGYGKLMGPDVFKPIMGPIVDRLGLPISGDILYWIVVAIELGGGALLLLGIVPRVVALGLAVWCVLTGFVEHYPLIDQDHLLNFTKNMAIAGGLLQITGLGAGRLSLTR